MPTPSSVSISARQDPVSIERRRLTGDMLVGSGDLVDPRRHAFILLGHPTPGEIDALTTPTDTSISLGDPRRVDWTASDGAKGRGDVGTRKSIPGP